VEEEEKEDGVIDSSSGMVKLTTPFVLEHSCVQKSEASDTYGANSVQN